MNPIGTHIILELSDIDHRLLNNLDFIRLTLFQSAKLAEICVLKDIFHQFEPQGVTGILLLAESHLSIHTWPEQHYAAIDFFTCGNNNIDAGMQYLISAFDCKNFRSQTISRGPATL